MSSSPVTLKLSVRIAWWLRPYLFVLSWFAVALGLEPKSDEVQRMVKRAVQIKVSKE